MLRFIGDAFIPLHSWGTLSVMRFLAGSYFFQDPIRWSLRSTVARSTSDTEGVCVLWLYQRGSLGPRVISGHSDGPRADLFLFIPLGACRPS